MKFRFEFDYEDDSFICPLLVSFEDEDNYCWENDKECTGYIHKRPDFCPLVEVKDEEIEVEA
jgi:hypothetical protein